MIDLDSRVGFATRFVLVAVAVVGGDVVAGVGVVDARPDPTDVTA